MAALVSEHCTAAAILEVAKTPRNRPYFWPEEWGRWVFRGWSERRIPEGRAGEEHAQILHVNLHNLRFSPEVREMLTPISQEMTEQWDRNSVQIQMMWTTLSTILISFTERYIQKLENTTHFFPKCSQNTDKDRPYVKPYNMFFIKLKESKLYKVNSLTIKEFN